MIRHSMVSAASLLLFALTPATAQSISQLDGLLTRAERTDFVETSRYDDVLAFVRRVAEASPTVHLTTFGYTHEGRALPLVVVGNVTGPDAASVQAAGLTRVFVQANIHAGEVCGKEAVQMLLREIALGEHAPWMDSLILLIAPIYNADGNERVVLTNRGRQHGPVAGMGQRPNGQGFDLNRDHMKIDAPETRALVGLMTRYDPHVGIDLHTTNGTRHAYHLTYSPPLHPNTDDAIMDLLRSQWLPFAQEYLRTDRGWESYYYGNASQRGTDSGPGWYTFDHRPRFNNNYLGLRNRFAILSEAYAYATFEDRILATKSFLEGSIQFAYENASHIRQLVRDADARSLAGQALGVRAVPHASGEIEVLMGATVEVRNPYSGVTMLQRVDTAYAVPMTDFGSFVVSEYETVPSFYVVPPELDVVIAKLQDHGVGMERVSTSREITADVFSIDSSHVAPREFQGHRERTLFGRYRQQTRRIPAGAFIVGTDQPLGRLVFSLLEPRSDDGLLSWGFLDGAVENSREYPIIRAR